MTVPGAWEEEPRLLGAGGTMGEGPPSLTAHCTAHGSPLVLSVGGEPVYMSPPQAQVIPKSSDRKQALSSESRRPGLDHPNPQCNSRGAYGNLLSIPVPRSSHLQNGLVISTLQGCPKDLMR